MGSSTEVAKRITRVIIVTFMILAVVTALFVVPVWVGITEGDWSVLIIPGGFFGIIAIALLCAWAFDDE